MTRKTGPAKGYKDHRGYSKCAVSFPDELFKKINLRAKAEGKTFTQMVVYLCQCGERDLEDSDQYEPKPEGVSLQ